MASKRLTTKEILDLTPDQLKGMTMSQLRQATSELQSTARSRVRHLRESDVAVASPAYRNIEKYDVEFKGIQGITKGMPEKQQRRELMKRMLQARSFLSDKTSSVKETRKVMGKILKKMNMPEGTKLTGDQWTKIWDTVEKYREMHPESKWGYQMAFGKSVDMVKSGADTGDVMNDIEQEHKRLYEAAVEQNTDMFKEI